MMVILKRKLQIFQKYSANKLLDSFRRAIDVERKDQKYAIGVPSITIDSERTLSVQTTAVDLELSRNIAIMYANMIPPR